MDLNRILLIEDEHEIADLLRMHLSELGFVVDHAADGESGLEMALEADYGAVILDRQLPKLDGLEVLRKLREQKKCLGVLMLTKQGAEIDKVVGLEVGADDYLAKPFKINELVARVKALLRRMREISEKYQHEDQQHASLTIGPMVVDTERRRVIIDGTEVDLSSREFDIVLLLASNAGRPFTRHEILRKIGEEGFANHYDDSITTAMSRMRKKFKSLCPGVEFIKTHHGLGYAFIEPEEAA